PETSITVIPFSVTAILPYPALLNKSITVTLSYSGSATLGSDYQSMPTSVNITIPKDSLEKRVFLQFTPINDIVNEGNEYVILKILPDTNFYRCNSTDSVVLEIVDNDQQYKPNITLEPLDLRLLEGDVGTFTIEVTGTPPFSYKWFKNGVLIPTAPSSAVYTIPPVSYADSGAIYRCIVTNSVGSDTSRNAVLHVSRRPVAPRIVIEPLSQTVTEGDSAVFKIVASGTSPLSFQWFCDTAAIVGARDSVLIIRSVKLSDHGKRYYCQVTNSVGGVLSKVAQLSVRRPSSQTIVITGDLYTSGYKPVGDVEETKMDFKIQLYATERGGSPLYTETFYDEDNKAIIVKNGKFVLVLGDGKTSDDLVETVRNNKNLYISFTVSTPGGNPETLDKRIPLTASPYALSSLPQIIKGRV
ncbi:MAG: immunoglobulin domain-containing protein, partial [Chitinispirillaceae bacterium]|nr:immunoglobulin domain-containing protein [Chitinispirillaceae bacterium]